MKPALCAVLLLLLSGCQINPYTFSPHWTSTDWYGAGVEDGRDGIKARSDEMLASDLNDPKVDRQAYLKGYTTGLDDVCQPHLLYGWGYSGKVYPEGCDSRQNAAELRKAWDKGMKEGTQSTSFH
ncbi:DUF2799 domain-containing protein [Enterobacteriaceae bacterium 89]|nr:DUF2799 domain-containing protein [Enterobacteriaceae bacterium 89]